LRSLRATTTPVAATPTSPVSPTTFHTFISPGSRIGRCGLHSGPQLRGTARGNRTQYRVRHRPGHLPTFDICISGWFAAAVPCSAAACLMGQRTPSDRQ
jgi:hypothetical protein